MVLKVRIATLVISPWHTRRQFERRMRRFWRQIFIQCGCWEELCSLSENGKLQPSRFLEGISFQKSAEDVHPETSTPHDLCCALCTIEQRDTFRGENRAKRCPDKGRKRGCQRGGGRKEGRVKTGQVKFYPVLRLESGGKAPGALPDFSSALDKSVTLLAGHDEICHPHG